MNKADLLLIQAVKSKYYGKPHTGYGRGIFADIMHAEYDPPDRGQIEECAALIHSWDKAARTVVSEHWGSGNNVADICKLTGLKKRVVKRYIDTTYYYVIAKVIEKNTVRTEQARRDFHKKLLIMSAKC